MPSRTTTYRYTLQRYSTQKSRTTCPACGKARCFSRYLDTDTGEVLPDKYGRCNHEVNCGHHLNPYHRDASGTSYARQMEGDNKLPYQTGVAGNSLVRRTPTSAQASATVHCIPADVFAATLGSYERNNLAQLLRGHFGAGVADELLRRFQVGTSAYRPGACVFWFIDEHGRVRGGKIMLFDETFHRVKTPNGRTTWAHTALRHHHQRLGRPAPPWLADYSEQGQKSPCLFGLPQLATTPPMQPVAVVESEKTAIVATPYLPQFVWLATGSLGQLTPDRMEPLRGRRIVLYPDAGCLDKWQAKANELRRLGFNVQVSDELERLATDDERRAGLDLADVLLREWPGYPPNWGGDKAEVVG